jgi:signal peptidase
MGARRPSLAARLRATDAGNGRTARDTTRWARRGALVLWLAFVVAPPAVHLLLRPTGHALLPTVGTSMGPDRAALALYRNRPGAVEVGDVIGFQSGDGHVNHRVIEVRPGPRYLTMGDANQSHDEVFVDADEVEGRQVASIPWAGLAYNVPSRVTPAASSWVAATVPLGLGILAVRRLGRLRGARPVIAPAGAVSLMRSAALGLER